MVSDGCQALAPDVTAACAFIDFDQYPNFDRIYFEESPGCFHLVYAREAYAAMERGMLPSDPALSKLVSYWLEARLAANSPGALELALQISWERHGIDWLSEGGRMMLELEAHLFLQNCSWETPKSFWKLFRGPVPLELDGRRKIDAIKAQ